MMYWKLSLRNARRSFTTYLLYILESKKFALLRSQ